MPEILLCFTVCSVVETRLCVTLLADVDSENDEVLLFEQLLIFIFFNLSLHCDLTVGLLLTGILRETHNANFTSFSLRWLNLKIVNSLKFCLNGTREVNATTPCEESREKLFSMS